jgi:hypothetical protein
MQICYAWSFVTHELIYHGENNHNSMEVLLVSQPKSTATTTSDSSATNPSAPTIQIGSDSTNANSTEG